MFHTILPGVAAGMEFASNQAVRRPHEVTRTRLGKEATAMNRHLGKGFTIIELLVVVAISSLLMA
jgi:prepilin-type N-terminal cleavage/methylation domain-containing protein